MYSTVYVYVGLLGLPYRTVSETVGVPVPVCTLLLRRIITVEDRNAESRRMTKRTAAIKLCVLFGEELG